MTVITTKAKSMSNYQNTVVRFEKPNGRIDTKFVEAGTDTKKMCDKAIKQGCKVMTIERRNSAGELETVSHFKATGKLFFCTKRVLYKNGKESQTKTY